MNAFFLLLRPSGSAAERFAALAPPCFGRLRDGLGKLPKTGSIEIEEIEPSSFEVIFGWDLPGRKQFQHDWFTKEEFDIAFVVNNSTHSWWNNTSGVESNNLNKMRIPLY